MEKTLENHRKTLENKLKRTSKQTCRPFQHKTLSRSIFFLRHLTMIEKAPQRRSERGKTSGSFSSSFPGPFFVGISKDFLGVF